MEKINLQANTEQIKPKEKKGFDSINVAIFDNSTVGKVMNKCFRILGNDSLSLNEDEEKLIEQILKNDTDTIVIPNANEKTVRLITKVRNNPDITHQPVIIVSNFDEKTLELIMKSGADIGIESPISLVDFIKSIASTPEMLANIEDVYGDKVLKSKQGFYKNYKDKLMQRSEITADTEKELEILEEVFEKNNVHQVLDAGGGAGRLSIPLSKKGYNIVNLDSSEALLGEMKKEDSGTMGVQGDLKELPIKDKSFDAVTFNWHIFCDLLGNKSKQKVAKESYRILKDDGVLVLDIPDLSSYDYMTENLDPELLNNPQEMVKKIKEFEKDYQAVDDSMARSILLQGRNMLAYALGKNQLHPETFAQDLSVNTAQVEIRKDGTYLNISGEEIFLGYIPKEDDIVKLLKESGFKDVKIKKWATKNSFYKISFIAKK